VQRAINRNIRDNCPFRRKENYEEIRLTVREFHELDNHCTFEITRNDFLERSIAKALPEHH